VEPWRYKDRWGLVTGASAGLGAVFAEKLAARGMHLALTARREDRLTGLASRLEAEYGIRTAVLPGDLAREGEPLRVWRHASAGRSIDLLVNNAGFGAKGHFADVALQRHVDLLRVNCEALTILAHLALTDMRPRRTGAIINLSSIAAFQPVPHLAVYAASKAFVLSFSETLTAENQRHGIRVLALCPGRTPTEFQAVAGTGSAEGTFGFRTPEQVVDAGLDALERGRTTEVPGFENAAATWAVRALPRSTVIRAMKMITRRFWKT
jgi:short-subunit dehydrogenase